MVKFFTTDGKFSFVKVGAQLLVVAALVLGVVAFVGNNKTVTLNVDGKVSSIQTFGGTVDQVVKACQGRAEGRGPGFTRPRTPACENGSVVNVNLAKAVSIELDGAREDRQHHLPQRRRTRQRTWCGQLLRGLPA